MQAFMLSEMHQRAANRLRREIIHYDTTKIIREGGMAPIGENRAIENYQARLFDYLDHVPHSIDSIHWDPLFDSGDEYALYPSKILPRFERGFYGICVQAGLDLYRLFTAGGRARGLENIFSHRLNGTDAGPGYPPRHKLEHPELYIKDWLNSGLQNLACPEIRERKLAILRETMENYDFDGIEIDYCRHTPFLLPGHQWELREEVTEFMRMLRQMLLHLENDKCRAFLLSARVPQTVAGCMTDGLDIREWARERLVDSLTIGSRSYEVDIEGFRQATDGCVKLYPCFDYHHCTDGYADPSLEVHRAVYANWWDRGADGVKLFNWYSARTEIYARTCEGPCQLPDHSQEQQLAEAGSADTLRFLDKTFVIERRGGYPWENGFANNNLDKQLPIELPNYGDERTATIYISDAVSQLRNQLASVLLTIVTSNLLAGDCLNILLNGHLLDGQYDFNWQDKQIRTPDKPLVSGFRLHQLPDNPDQKLQRISVLLDPGMLAKGNNKLAVSARRDSQYRHCEKIFWEKAEIAVKYRQK